MEFERRETFAKALGIYGPEHCRRFTSALGLEKAREISSFLGFWVGNIVVESMSCLKTTPNLIHSDPKYLCVWPPAALPGRLPHNQKHTHSSLFIFSNTHDAHFEV